MLNRGANYFYGACTLDLRSIKDIRPDLKDFEDLKYSNCFRSDFKAFRSGFWISAIKSRVSWILGQILEM